MQSSFGQGGDRLRARLCGTISAAAMVAAGIGMTLTATAISSTNAEAKTPGKTYCFYRTCHRVLTLDETRRAVGKRMTLHASHYDDPKKDRYNPSNLTSSGEFFRSGVPDNAASPILPNGTVILAWNPLNLLGAVLRINNAGPYWGNRTLDVSRAAADKLGFARKGVAKLQVQVVRAPTKEEATYRKGRHYAAVPGPIGTHSSFDLALADAARLMHEPTIAPSTLVAGLTEGQTAEAEAMAKTAPAESSTSSATTAQASGGSVVATAGAEPAPEGLTRSPEVDSRNSLPSLTTTLAMFELPVIRGNAVETAKPLRARKIAKVTRVAQAKPSKNEVRRARTRTSSLQPTKASAVLRSRVSGARTVALASVSQDEDEIEYVRQRPSPVSRRAVSAYTQSRWASSCRDSDSCEVSMSPNGSVMSSRSWRVSSSKRP